MREPRYPGRAVDVSAFVAVRAAREARQHAARQAAYRERKLEQMRKLTSARYARNRRQLAHPAGVVVSSSWTVTPRRTTRDA